MRFPITLVILLAFVCPMAGQSKLDKTLKKFNKESVPYTYVEEMGITKKALLLDTREREEYEVSHLKNAIWVGHKEFERDAAMALIGDKDREIIVYCSIGVRSEIIGQKLMEAGCTDVKNLYGGIFEWKNKGREVYSPEGTETDSVHAFDKHWGKLLKRGIKVYDRKKK